MVCGTNMGGAKSKASSEVVSEIITNVLTQTILSCAISVAGEQGIDIEGSGNYYISGVDLSQNIIINASCIQDVNIINKLQEDIATAVTQVAQSKGIALLGAFQADRAETHSKVKQLISNSINQQTIQHCINNINMNQMIRAHVTDANVVITNIKAQQLSDNTVKCSQNLAANTDLVQSLKTSSQQTSGAQQENPMNFLVEMVKQYSIWIIVFIVVIGVAIIVYSFTGSESSPSVSYEPNPLLTMPEFRNM